MSSQTLAETIFALVSMVVGIALLAFGFERRVRSRWKMLAILAIPWVVESVLILLWSLSPSGYELYTSMTPLASALFSASIWAVIPLSAIIVIYAFFDTDAWSATFCAAAGYTLQNLASGAADIVELVLGAGDTQAVPIIPTLAIELFFVIVFYLAAWHLLVEPIHEHGLTARRDRRMLLLLGLVFIAVILFDTLNKQLAELGTDLSLVLALKFVHIVVCFFALTMSYELLVNRHLREEAVATQSLLEAQRRIWELSRENVEAINVKCHDIRHQIRRIGAGADSSDASSISAEVLDDIEREVSIYDSLIHTGNDALDTILSEKGLICEQEGISFHGMADGTAASFMTPADIYALFGNALDNAIEASHSVDLQENRSISLDVRMVAGVFSIHVENRFSHDLQLDQDGIPLTTKGDTFSHGFGMRSMRLTAERYGGTLAVRALGDVFHLNIAIPEPEGFSV